MANINKSFFEMLKGAKFSAPDYSDPKMQRQVILKLKKLTGEEAESIFLGTLQYMSDEYTPKKMDITGGSAYHTFYSSVAQEMPNMKIVLEKTIRDLHMAMAFGELEGKFAFRCKAVDTFRHDFTVKHWSLKRDLTLGQSYLKQEILTDIKEEATKIEDDLKHYEKQVSQIIEFFRSVSD